MRRRSYNSESFKLLAIALVVLFLVRGGDLIQWPQSELESVMPAVETELSTEGKVKEQDGEVELKKVIRTRIIEKLDALEEPLKHKTKKKAELNPISEKDRREASIVIIIDDMGMNRSNTLATLDLPKPLTLAFLPYADHLNTYTQAALGKGHELMVHVPMEPINSELSLGGMGITTDMNQEQIQARLNDEILPAFDGYRGINNHMGSLLTQDSERLAVIMKEVKKRNLYFIDSKTIETSVAADIAKQQGVAFAERDIFLDHYDDLNSVKRALHRLEKLAYKKGIAIAIGHPKNHTLEALKEWLPTLEEKKLTLIPASEAVQKQDNRSELLLAHPDAAMPVQKKSGFSLDFKSLLNFYSSDNKITEPVQWHSEPLE